MRPTRQDSTSALRRGLAAPYPLSREVCPWTSSVEWGSRSPVRAFHGSCVGMRWGRSLRTFSTLRRAGRRTSDERRGSRIRSGNGPTQARRVAAGHRHALRCRRKPLRRAGRASDPEAQRAQARTAESMRRPARRRFVPRHRERQGFSESLLGPRRPLHGDDYVGPRAVGPRSLLRVVGALGQDASPDGAPMFHATYYRHFPRFFYVTRASARELRQ